MLRYKVTRNGITTIEACCVREFFSPDSPAPPGAQILEIFDPDDRDCKYNDDYIYTYPDEGEPQYIDLVYATVMVPNNKGGYDKIARIQPMPQFLLNNPNISIIPADPICGKNCPRSTIGPQLSPISVVPVRHEPSCDKDEKATNYKEESRVKRPSTSQDFNVPKKFRKNNVYKPDALHQTVLDKASEVTKGLISKTIIPEDYPSGLTSTKTNRVPQEPTITHSTEDLNLAENNGSIMIPNTSFSVCVNMTDELDKSVVIISKKVKTRMFSALLQIINEEDKEEFTKSEKKRNCLQPISPSKVNRSLEAKDSKLNSANSNNITNQVGIKSSKPKIPYQQPSTSKQWIAPIQATKIPSPVVPQQPTTSKQSVVSQQPSTSKQSVVSQQPSTSKQSVVSQQPSTSKQSVVSQQPSTSKQSVVSQQPSTSKQSVVSQQPSTSKQSVVPQQPPTSKQSVVPQQPTTSKQSVVPQQPTTSKQSVVSQQPSTSKQSVVSQQPSTSKQSVVPQQPSTSKQSVVPQQPSTSKQSVVPQQPSTSKQSVVPQQPPTLKQSVVPQQPPTSKQSVVPQQPTTSKQSVVPQQPTTSKQSVVPQQPSTSKQSVVPQQPSTSKQSVVPQQPSTSKQSVVSVTQLPLVTKQLITQLSVKPPVACQSPQLQNVKNCKTCNSVLSDNGDCQTCHMSKLKGITVTRINAAYVNKDEEKDKTIDKDQDKDQSKDKENDKDKVKDNMPIDEPICLISSDEEDCDNVEPHTNSYGEEKKLKAVEPVIARVESTEIIKSYIAKLNTNPKLLEDKLWQKDLSSKDFFKFEQKNTNVIIGNFTTSPVGSGDVFICLHGVRMTVHGLDMNPATIDVLIENIVKILGYYGDQPAIIIYTTNLAAIGIRLLLNIGDNNKMHNYDPLSEDNTVKKIVWTFDKRKHELHQLEKLLLKLPKGKYAPLTKAEAHSMIPKSQRKEECKKLAELKSVDYESYPLTDEHLDGRVVTPVKICDYRMLNIDEFLNDTIVEFYLNYWFCRKLSLEDRNRTYLFDTFFYTSLSKKKMYDTKIKSRHDRVKKWTKKVNIFEKDFIFIPINENLHWFMAVICYPHLTGAVHYEDGTELKTLYEDDFGDYERPSPKPCEPYAERDEADGNTEDFRYYPNFSHDGKNTGNYQTDVDNLKKKNRIPIKQPVILIFDSLNGHTARARIVATLREWLSEEYRTKYNGAERDFSLRAVKGSVVKVPQQPNYTDCGLFVMHYFQKFFECPIIDYSCPILHLGNWFSIDDISKNCLKRREVQSIILKVMHEQGRSLPSGILLPELRFSKPEQQNNLLIQPRQFQHNQQIQNRQFYYNNQGRDINIELDNFNEEDNAEIYDESENGQYPVDHSRYGYHSNMEVSQDDGQYYGQITGPWNDSQEEGDYQSESDFDMEQSNTFNGNAVLYHSVHTPRNHNHQNMAGNNMPSYNENYDEESDEEMDDDVIEDIDDDVIEDIDEDEEIYEEDEDEEVDEDVDEEDEDEEVDEYVDEEEDSNDESTNHPRYNNMHLNNRHRH